MAFRVITTALTCLWTSEKIRIGLTGPIQDLGKFLKKNPIESISKFHFGFDKRQKKI